LKNEKAILMPMRMLNLSGTCDICGNDCFYSKYNEKKKNLQNILSVKKAGTHIGKDRCMTRGQGNRQNTDGSDHQTIKHLKKRTAAGAKNHQHHSAEKGGEGCPSGLNTDAAGKKKRTRKALPLYGCAWCLS
jgi:hypothetical protein